jgi:hypothetical protein
MCVLERAALRDGESISRVEKLMVPQRQLSLSPNRNYRRKSW